MYPHKKSGQKLTAPPMTFPDQGDMRDVEPDDASEDIPAIRGSDFILQHRQQKIYIRSGRPVHGFDIFRSPRDGTERIGRATLILDPDVENVHDIGQISAKLQRNSDDPGLLARVVWSLCRYAAQKGIKRVRIVVPRNERTAIQACERLQGEVAVLSEKAARRGLVGFEIRSS
jgi:hypothetical protein